MNSEIKRITLFGSGKVATQLGKAFLELGLTIAQVWSRNLSSANELAEQLQTRGISKFNQLRASDLYVVAISDDAIYKFIHSLPKGTPVVHTSGNTPLVTRESGESDGVFYPLQTFSKIMQPEWKNIPICLEASNEAFLKSLYELGESLSNTVKVIDSAERSILHVSAVIACNFVNHLGALSEEVLASKNLDLSLLQALIDQTFQNISSGDVKSKQTGPAYREDYGTIDNHLSLLEDKPDIKALYLSLSKHIIQYHHGE